MIAFTTGARVYLRSDAYLTRFAVGGTYGLYRRDQRIGRTAVTVTKLHKATASVSIEDPAGLRLEMRRGDELRRCE